jgi:hypothetical protein
MSEVKIDPAARQQGSKGDQALPPEVETWSLMVLMLRSSTLYSLTVEGMPWRRIRSAQRSEWLVSGVDGSLDPDTLDLLHEYHSLSLNPSPRAGEGL